jgi:hypothetical protein
VNDENMHPAEGHMFQTDNICVPCFHNTDYDEKLNLVLQNK